MWPDAQTGSKSDKSRSKIGQKLSTHIESGSSPEEHELELEHDVKDPLPPIPDDEEADPAEYVAAASESYREGSDTPSLILDRSPSPSTETSSVMTNPVSRPLLSRKSSNQAMKPSVGFVAAPRSILEFPQDVRFCLHYHRRHISVHHYALKRDSNNFLKTTFLDIAVRDPPLLYAVVGFAAYYHTLTHPEGRIHNFLQYYNKSVALLRESLQKKHRHSLATLMTILQLANIEVR